MCFGHLNTVQSFAFDGNIKYLYYIETFPLNKCVILTIDYTGSFEFVNEIMGRH